MFREVRMQVSVVTLSYPCTRTVVPPRLPLYIYKTQNMKVFDGPTPEELTQKLKATEVNMRRGSGTSVKIS
jgi:hypothetical protein